MRSIISIISSSNSLLFFLTNQHLNQVDLNKKSTEQSQKKTEKSRIVEASINNSQQQSKQSDLEKQTSLDSERKQEQEGSPRMFKFQVHDANVLQMKIRRNLMYHSVFFNLFNQFQMRKQIKIRKWTKISKWTIMLSEEQKISIDPQPYLSNLSALILRERMRIYAQSQSFS